MKTCFYSAMLVITSFAVPAFAKAPEAPTRPETELKVLPAHTQEFFQFDKAPPPNAFAPVLEVAPIDVFWAGLRWDAYVRWDVSVPLEWPEPPLTKPEKLKVMPPEMR